MIISPLARLPAPHAPMSISHTYHHFSDANQGMACTLCRRNSTTDILCNAFTMTKASAGALDIDLLKDFAGVQRRILLTAVKRRLSEPFSHFVVSQKVISQYCRCTPA